MNTVHIELNSYTQEVRFFVNGIQTDPYSALSNFTYEQVLKNPAEILEAVSRELNDDFELELTATDWEYRKIEDVAFDFEDCNSCSARQPAIDLSARERAEKLGEKLPVRTITVLTAGYVPQSKAYGNLTLCFTNDPAQATCTSLAKEADVLSAAEALLVNPAIGRAAKEAAAVDSSYAVCFSLSPVVSVSFPRSVQAGEQLRVRVTAFPEGQPVPPVTVRSSSPDIASVEGTVIHAHNTGITNIQVFLAGENIPFHSQKIRVEKNVYVSRIEVPNLEGTLPEGQTLSLDLRVFPPDASDAQNLKFHSSDPDVAEFEGNQLKLKASGECDILITGKKAFYSKKVRVSAKLQEYILSVDNLELNLGQRYPVEVQCVPEICYNSAYTWVSTDKTVAIVVEDEGQQYIKAIGMGTCSITCRSADQSVKAECTVTVKSAMYKKKTLADYKKDAAAVMGFAKGLASSAKKVAGNVVEKASAAYEKRTAPMDAFADVEVQFSGENGSGTVTIVNHSAHPFLKACIYTACPARDLSNGQSISILVGTTAAGKRHPGCTVEKTSMSVIVSGLEE